MRALKVAVAVACCALGISFVSQSEAQNTGTFAFKVCNVTGLKISVSLMTLTNATDQKYHVHGWYTVNPARTGCQDFGVWPKGYFYWYAQEDGSATEQYAVWAGTVDKCVAFPGPFDRAVVPNYSCVTGEELVKFTEKLVEPGTNTYTLTLR